jgi:serine phosphatase RsbU (regulator of sigma subunit)
VLFLYTDGVAQARGQGNSYFQDRLADELTGLAGSPADQLVASMRQAMLQFSKGNLIDDVTMLVLRAGRPSKGTASALGGTSSARRSLSPAAQD